MEWPFGWCRAVTGYLAAQELLQALPKAVLKPQNVIPCDAPVIKACEICNMLQVQRLLQSKLAHPNDCTPEGRTMLRVRCLSFLSIYTAYELQQSLIP